MFPLSEVSENLALAWLDTYYWSEFETEMVPKLQEGIPRLMLIKDAGKSYSLYEGDLYDLKMITEFLSTSQGKDQIWHALPRGRNPEFLQLVLGSIPTVFSKVSQRLFAGVGLGEAHWGLQFSAVATFVFIHYLVIWYLLGSAQSEKLRKAQ